MFTIKQLPEFEKWLKKLRDNRARVKIVARLDRFQFGLLGDIKPVGEGVSEMRVDYGPGYRVYFHQKGEEIIILLCGGDKKTQDADIKKAKVLLKNLS